MSDKDKGIYNKFKVERTDGKSAPGEKHDNCEYFVLDLTHDKYAAPAIKAYALACRDEFPVLADELERKACLACPHMQAMITAGWCYMFKEFHPGCKLGNR